MRTMIMTVLALLILSAQGACETKIYTWTDANGVKQFSDEPPPEGVQRYDIITDRASQDNTADNTSEANTRPGYEKMMRSVERENRQADLNKAQAETQRAKAAAQQAQAAEEAKREAQRQRIQKKIDALNQRALSPTFSKGMRDAQIKELQEQMEAIK